MELVVGFSCVRKFGKGTRWIKAFADGDSNVVVEVVSLAVSADLELVGNGLAVDCVEQEYNSLETEWVELKFTAFVSPDDGPNL